MSLHVKHFFLYTVQPIDSEWRSYAFTNGDDRFAFEEPIKDKPGGNYYDSSTGGPYQIKKMSNPLKKLNLNLISGFDYNPA